MGIFKKKKKEEEEEEEAPNIVHESHNHGIPEYTETIEAAEPSIYVISVDTNNAYHSQLSMQDHKYINHAPNLRLWHGN
jgi:hypothetical protein